MEVSGKAQRILLALHPRHISLEYFSLRRFVVVSAISWRIDERKWKKRKRCGTTFLAARDWLLYVLPYTRQEKTVALRQHTSHGHADDQLRCSQEHVYDDAHCASCLRCL